MRQIDVLRSIYSGDGEFEFIEATPVKFGLHLPLDSAMLPGESAHFAFSLPPDYPTVSPPAAEVKISALSDDVCLGLAHELASLAANQYLHSECILDLCADLMELVAVHLEHEANNGPMLRPPDRALFFVFLYIHSAGLPNLALCCRHLKDSFEHCADRLSTARERLCVAKMKRTFGASCTWSWLLYQDYRLSCWFLREELLDAQREVFPALNIACVLFQRTDPHSILAHGDSPQTKLETALEAKVGAADTSTHTHTV